MRAVDTNVVVRLFVRDDEDQWARAKALFADHAIWISLTVILEAEWVLRSVYKRERKQIAAALGGIAGLENVSIENPAALTQALGLFEGGMDFADAIHVSVAAFIDDFVTFDADLASRSARHGSPRVALL